MRKSFLLAISAIATFALTSCFQSESTIHLNKDGSGTIVQEIRLGAQLLAMMSGFGGGEEGAAPDPVAGLLSEEKAKAGASKLGEGVTFEKAEAVNINGSKGARITCRFADINKLKLSMNDSMEKMSADAEGPEPDPAAKERPITFAYAGGKLTIKMPEPEKKAAPPVGEVAEKVEEANDPGAEEMMMMKQMLGDMKMSMRIVIEPGIAETNATHRNENTITLMEMEMKKLVENPDQIKKLTSIDQEDPAAAMEALKGIEGIKFETKPEITVTLK